MVRYLELHPEVGLLGCDWRFVDAEGRPFDYPETKPRFAPEGLWLKQLPPEERKTPFASVFTLCGIIPSAALIRRSIYEQTPGFDELLGQHREDTDVFLHLALRSEIHYLDEKLLNRRRHHGQYTTDTPEFRRINVLQGEKFYEKWRRGEGLSDCERKMVRAAWRFKEGRLEPYFAFERARAFWKDRQIIKSIRFYFGGLRRYVSSFLPDLPRQVRHHG